MDTAWRRHASVCDVQRFDFQRTALSTAPRAAVESASLAQFSTVLCPAATHAADAGIGSRDPAHPQGGPHERPDTVGVVGAVDRVACHLRDACVVPFCAHGAAYMRAGSEISRTQTVCV